MWLLCEAAFLLREKSNGVFWNGGYVFVDNAWMRLAWCANARSVVGSVCVRVYVYMQCEIVYVACVVCVCGFGMKP